MLPDKDLEIQLEQWLQTYLKKFWQVGDKRFFDPQVKSKCQKKRHREIKIEDPSQCMTMHPVHTRFEKVLKVRAHTTRDQARCREILPVDKGQNNGRMCWRKRHRQINLIPSPSPKRRRLPAGQAGVTDVNYHSALLG
jgi:hypothetical protein